MPSTAIRQGASGPSTDTPWTKLFGHETGKSSIDHTQLVQLIADKFVTLLSKRSTGNPTSRQLGHGESTPEATSDTVGLGDHEDAVSSRKVNLISR